jgi:F-type H+-transporting ATPase subunit delta
MRIHLGGRSRQSFVIARGELDLAVKGASAEVASTLSSDLFLAAEVIAGNISLRRAITDPSRELAAKSALIKDLFGKTMSELALNLLSKIAAVRWSSGQDVVYVLEQLAIEAEASSANINNELDRLEDELFEISRLIADSFELSQALAGRGSVDAKSALLAEIFGKKASTSTLSLATTLVKSLRGRSIEAAFADYLFGLANRRNRLIAVVRTATSLSDSQSARLSKALEKHVGQPIRVNIQLDPSILGGVSVKFADELVDGSVSHRLADAGRALAGIKA